MSTLLGALAAVFWGVIVLSVLVFVHEGGHFLMARACGMRATEFFLGLPCRLKLSRRSRRHGTEYGVTPLLLGGYTRICGMEGEAPECAADVLAYVASHGRASVSEVAEACGVSKDEALQALAILSDWATLEPYYDASKGERPNQKYLPETFQTVARDPELKTVYDPGHDLSREGATAAGEPHGLGEGGAQGLLSRERDRTYQGKGFIRRVAVLLAGPAVNIVCGLGAIAIVLMLMGVTVASNTSRIGGVEAGSLAQAAGIVPGDTVTEVAGTPVSTWQDLSSELKEQVASGKDFDVTFVRDGQSQTARITRAQGDGQTLLGVTPSTEVVHPGTVDALRGAWGYVTFTASYVLQLLQPSHVAEVVSQSSSVVGISVMASQAASQGVLPLLYVAAAISLSLGFMNLLPIPPLDGGKILIELIALVIRRPVPVRVQNALSYVGIALVMTLFVVVLRQDIVRFVFGG